MFNSCVLPFVFVLVSELVSFPVMASLTWLDFIIDNIIAFSILSSFCDIPISFFPFLIYS